MKHTVNIPKKLLEEVMRITSAKTKSEAVKIALEELISIRKRKRLIAFKGTIDLDIDLYQMRKRI